MARPADARELMEERAAGDGSPGADVDVAGQAA
jgi:hypothetical protein